MTLVCKLNPSQKQAEEIEWVLTAFESACNYANQKVKPQITSKMTIQNLVYNEIRALFGLSANLAVRACARVGANRKTAKLKNKPVKAFKPTLEVLSKRKPRKAQGLLAAGQDRFCNGCRARRKDFNSG
nr:transposase [Fischerella thermalis]